MVYSVLADAGIDLAPIETAPDGADVVFEGVSPFVRDAYFDATVREQSVEPVAVDVNRVRDHQNSVVISYLAADPSLVEREVLETLVTDGGQVAPADIAAENDRHVESVRRALRQVDGLLDRAYGTVRSKSDYIAGLIHDSVVEAREAVRRGAESTTEEVTNPQRDLTETMGAFLAWADRQGVDVYGAREAQMELRFHGTMTASERNRAINPGYEVWTDAGMASRSAGVSRRACCPSCSFSRSCRSEGPQRDADSPGLLRPDDPHRLHQPDIVRRSP